MAQKKINKILLLRFSSLGDIIMTTAAVRCVRKAFPQAQIDMAVRSDFFDLIKYNPHLNQKISLSRGEGLRGLARLRRQVNSEGYDLIYDLHRSLRTLLLMPFLKAGAKAYYKKHYLCRSLALTFKLPLLDRTRMLERFIEPMAPWGVCYDDKGPEIFLSPENREKAQKKVPVPATRLVGLVPSAQWPGKRWPLEKFRLLIEALIQKTSFTLIVFGGPSDTFCSALVEGLPEERVINAQGKLSLLESAALVEKCDFVVANDTGLMHVADALKIPSVLIFGPTSAEMGCLPFHPLSQVVELSMWCRPCSKNGQAPCIRGKRHCLEDISVERVLSSVERIAQLVGGGSR